MTGWIAVAQRCRRRLEDKHLIKNINNIMNQAAHMKLPSRIPNPRSNRSTFQYSLWNTLNLTGAWPKAFSEHMLVDKATCAETAQSQWVDTCIAIVNNDMCNVCVRTHLGQSVHMCRMPARHGAGQICRSQTKVHKHVHNQAAPLKTRQNILGTRQHLPLPDMDVL